MTALTFVLTELETGRTVGHALLCAEARYAGVLSLGESRIDRRFAGPIDWVRVDGQVAGRIETGRLDRDSAIVSVLLGADRRSAIAVQHLVSTPFEIEPGTVPAALDAQLRGFAATPMLRLRQSENP